MKHLKTSFFGFLYINILFILLILTNLIPKESILKNLKECSYMYESEYKRKNFIENLNSTKQDYVADILSLEIMYYEDSRNLIDSALMSNYYHDGYIGYGKSYEKMLNEDVEPNFEYGRYWHGYIIFYKILLTFLNIAQIKLLFFIVFLFINFLIIKKNINEKYYKLLIAFVASEALSSIFFCFVSLEYILCLIISLIFAYAILLIKDENLNLLFLLSGISIAFFDFLTIETLGFTLPLVFLIGKKYYKNEIIKIKQLFIYGVYFIFGYLGSFLYKWILVALHTKNNFLIDSWYHFSERAGAYNSYNIWMPIKYNLEMLSYNNLTIVTIIFFIGLILLYLFRKKDFNKNNYVLFLSFVFLIPFVRYSIMKEHSLIHCFFTYRAQMTSIMCFIFILSISIDKKMIREVAKNESFKNKI